MTSQKTTPRHRKLHRALALAAAAAAATTLALIPGITSARSSAPCTVSGHRYPAGTAIKVDARGNAWTTDTSVPGPVQVLACTAGRWTVQP